MAECKKKAIGQFYFLFAKYAGTDIKINNEMLKIVSVKDVLGVLEA